jgi:Family of unknown function (DUF6526)
MSDDAVQNYDNHYRWLPLWHFFVLPVFAINVIVSLVVVVEEPSVGTMWRAVVAIALAIGIFYARYMPLRVQDRVVCLEETLRLERLLPDRHFEIEKLTTGQLIGTRFASDAEIPHLLDRVMSGELTTRDEIKRAVQHWRPDHLRA